MLVHNFISILRTCVGYGAQGVVELSIQHKAKSSAVSTATTV